MMTGIAISIVRALVLAILLLGFAQIVAAQPERALPPVADPRDTRFRGVEEDWSTPSLSSSNLKPVQPLRAYVADYPGYTVELLQLQWRWGDPIDLYVLMPVGIRKPPVILYLYGYPSDTDQFKDEKWQKAVTRDGFAAVGFVSALTGQRYHDRPMREWFLSELPEALSTSAHDVQMILNYLATRDDLDLSRVGMFAHGSGASIAILTSAVDPRIKVLDTVDPWGDWPTWMANSPFVPDEERPRYVTHEFLKLVAPLEPLQWLPRIQAKEFRLQDATFESNTPAAAKEMLRARVPPGARVVIYKTAEEFNLVIREKRELEWITRELRAQTNPSP